MRKNDFTEHKKQLYKELDIPKDKIDLSLKYFEKGLKHMIRHEKPFKVYDKVTLLKLRKR
jgi:hypothetical protein|tara:strand:- start:674 stop:853 length:180 start_codon:yes stop_codon:yes gene_type:complete